MLFLRAGYHQLESRQQILLTHQFPPLADGPQSRFVHLLRLRGGCRSEQQRDGCK